MASLTFPKLYAIINILYKSRQEDNMKKKILSFLTSVAMSATVVTGTLSSTVSAATVVDKESTMVLRFAPEKTSFTMEEVKAGTARTTVALMCDNYDAAEEVTMILTSFKGNDEGIKFQNINITDPNAFTIDGGFGILAMDIEVSGFDPVDNTKITDQTGFFIQNGISPFVLGDKNNSIVTFDVIFDSSMEAGTYTVDFMDNFAVNSGVVSGDGTVITTYGNSVNANSAPAVFTLGDTTSSDIVRGDITGDGKVNLYDAIEICKYIMGMRTITAEEEVRADYDENEKVDLYDAIGIAKLLLE